jgi:hypothetical protein
MPKTDHNAFVTRWMEGATLDLPEDGLLPLFERAFGAIWTRALVGLGEITLTAIADRVLYTAAERFPPLSSIKVAAGGLQCQLLAARAAELTPDRLVEALRFTLVEFLTVLGSLTAEVLTPALHAELSKVAPSPSPVPQEIRPRTDGEEPKP